MPDTPFNPVSMPLERLCGYWSDNNSLGVIIQARGKIRTDWQQYSFRLKAKDNPKNIDFIKYLAFLADPRHRKVLKDAASGYEEKKEQAYKRQMMLSKSGRDIGALPDVADGDRKEACRRDFRKFCEVYFSETFNLEWSPDHLVVINRMESCVLEGGLFTLAMPRGSGKSSLCEAACVWAMVYGHRDFIALVGSTEGASEEMLESIKTVFESNEILGDDFPEVCYPIRQLDGIANRCAGQLFNGERTRITWTSNEIVLPTIAGSSASGVVVRVAGITGRIRGMKYKRSDGKTTRPSLVIVDDPQTSESANSIEQTRKRVRVIEADILGLAGPGKKIAGVMPCTVIRNGDLADQMLDRGKHPEWNGERIKMLYDMPKNMKLWEEYSEIRAESLRESGNIQQATEFYRLNREAMDEGARVSWEARFNSDELSAIQHAMNLKLTDEVSFQAEYQNEPMPDDLAEDILLTVDEICGKLNGLKRGIVPMGCTKLTMFVDIQKTLLFWCVCAWTEEFGGSVIDYGAWPDQHRIRFSLQDANPTFMDKFPKAGLEGQIFGALKALFAEQMPREFQREDGAVLHIERAMVDANWGLSTDVVYQFCRQSEYSSMVMPSHGRYVGASSKPMTEYRKKPGERVGFNWIMPSVNGKRAIRHVIYDTNFWKSFVHSRLSVAAGDPGSLDLFGRNSLYHQLFAEHLTAEYRVKTQGLGRTVDEWKLKAAHMDNHWLDCLSGCAVCASILGCALPVQMTEIPKPKKIVLSETAQDSRKPPAFSMAESPELSVKHEKVRLSDIQRTKKYF